MQDFLTPLPIRAQNGFKFSPSGGGEEEASPTTEKSSPASFASLFQHSLKTLVCAWSVLVDTAQCISSASCLFGNGQGE